MDLETLQFRARTMQRIREFFIQRGYLELDTPALSSHLIPESCLEVFRTEYIYPGTQEATPLYLVPSPEVHIKPLIARHKVSMFQLSKCYRNLESCGRIHSPEFTMLEYYTVNANYMDTAAITEELFNFLLPPPAADRDNFAYLRPPFMRLTMDQAFFQYAGFYLSSCTTPQQLAKQARKLGIYEPEDNSFDSWPWDDLYELILVQCVEPQLPKHKPVLLMDYPAQVPCLAQDVPNPTGAAPLWKQRWELYVAGVELSNCYSEETDPEKIRSYFQQEGQAKEKSACVPHAIDENYWKHFQTFPTCSGNALGVDRLIALLQGRTTIEGVLP
ncbi:MAG: LysR family transcriptional regulator [Treponema sp.]|nr:LysR family transcriptional regulator [Treponema sp.]MDY4673792.1 amino acid--tRNA ligase-related protein [Treponema sp.]